MLRTLLRPAISGLRTAATKTLTPARRGIWSWGMVPEAPGENRFKNKDTTRYAYENLAPDVSLPNMHGVVAAVYSEAAADLAQLKATDWTYSYDAFWNDLDENYQRALHQLETGYFGKVSEDDIHNLSKIVREVEKVTYWAQQTHDVYSTIADWRFRVERDIENPFEREKILAGLCRHVQDFYNGLPTEFADKIRREIDYHIYSFRRSVYDIPNVKREFPDYMN